MQQATMLMLSAEELKTIVQEAVSEAVKQLDIDGGRIEKLPALLTREEFMKVMHISAPTATKIFDRPDFRIFRQGKLLIETEFLFQWIRKNSDWVEENTGYFRTVS